MPCVLLQEISNSLNIYLAILINVNMNYDKNHQKV